jgi:ribosomal protein S18 acetylase RimI-like enzyme
MTHTTEFDIQLKYVGSIADPMSDKAVAIKRLLIKHDNDFVPPLSFREDATRAIADMKLHETDIVPYFETILAQKNIIALHDNKIIAFLSFQHNYENHFPFSTVAKEGDVINYISTIIVEKEFRRLLVANRLYEFIEHSLPNDMSSQCVSTRTWSTNESHIKLLAKRDYELTCTMHKDRRTSVGLLDSIYFCKRITANQLI